MRITYPYRAKLSASDSDTRTTLASEPPSTPRRAARHSDVLKLQTTSTKTSQRYPFQAKWTALWDKAADEQSTTTRIVPPHRTFAQQTVPEHHPPRPHSPATPQNTSRRNQRRSPNIACNSPTPPSIAESRALILRGFQGARKEGLRGIACEMWGGLSGTSGIDDVDGIDGIGGRIPTRSLLGR